MGDYEDYRDYEKSEMTTAQKVVLALGLILPFGIAFMVAIIIIVSGE